MCHVRQKDRLFTRSLSYHLLNLVIKEEYVISLIYLTLRKLALDSRFYAITLGSGKRDMDVFI